MAETNETGAGNAVAAAGDNPKHPWPVVDEQYWLDRAKQMLDNPEERWTTTIKTLNKYILYIYGLYTAGVVAAGIIDKLQVSGGMLFVLSLPYLFLFGAYAASHWSAMPLARYGKNGEGFDPARPMRYAMR